MRDDRMWMYSRRDESGKGLNKKFIDGVEQFVAFVLSQPNLVSNGQIRCPCSKYDNKKFLEYEIVKVHLYRHGFVPNYDPWSYHGEPLHYDDVDYEVARDIEERVEDAVGPSVNPNTNIELDDPPSHNAQKFYEMLETAKEPLYEGCSRHTPLSAISRLLNIKSEFNLSENCYNCILQWVKELLPNDEKLPKDYYKTKQMVGQLGLKYEKIDVCRNGCMLYYKENKERRECLVCGHDRFKSRKRDNGSNKDIPYKVLRYFPLTPRLQRLYMSSKTAEHMVWHHKTRREPGVMCHPCDGEAWKHFDQCYPSFALEPQNVRLGLSLDGFTPFGQSAHPYSCWPVIVTPYNLPPGMCMKTPYMFLTLIIPGPKSPGQKIDVYLQPLIDELKELWEVGALTYDSYKKQNFYMRASLLWTINDFPAYGMLSGWSTRGILSCPICMEYSKSFFLEKGKKVTFFDCHRQFLPLQHPFRRDKKSFYKGCDEKSPISQRFSSDDLWEKVCCLPRMMEKNGTYKLPGFGSQHNWTKRSIFWDLPYWNTNLIRHNLDVMHIEKNVFDNIFNTVMDVKGKTKDNEKAREDLSTYCNRPELALFKSVGKTMKPKATYTLTKQQRKLVCEWIKNLRLPDGHASNLSKCVDMENCKLLGMKSHDCHVFLQRLLPIAFKDLLPEAIWNALTEISLFFKDICSTIITVEQMQKLEENIVVTICKLEKFFPPAFFDSMEHFLFTYLMKQELVDPFSIDGCIHLKEETSTFCAHYFEPHVQTKLNKIDRNDDHSEVDCPDGCLSIFRHPGRTAGKGKTQFLTNDEFNVASIYVLLNCEEIQPFLRIFEEQLRKRIPNATNEDVETKIDSEFAKWLKEYVFDPNNNVDDVRIKDLAFRPSREVHTWSQYFINGYRFHTRAYNSSKSTMNCGLCIKGTNYNEFEYDYYGLLEEVIELQYYNPTSKKTRAYEPFALAQQAQQVYFGEYASKKRERADWWAICKIKARSMINAPEVAFQEDDMGLPYDTSMDAINNLCEGVAEELEIQENEMRLQYETNDVDELEKLDEEDELENEEFQTEEEDELSESDSIESDESNTEKEDEA
ncbi:uncharacterized protein LOC129292331 [Prosopis cineraria]|uniref:uncharacterized protein LOC129292331 n=1 Tax=Prosopis cineraria TaxID=364024 RepID=UPI00240FE69C|nr:uncharacterized protein LOC129292331 [Prosopis cineraria]